MDYITIEQNDSLIKDFESKINDALEIAIRDKRKYITLNLSNKYSELTPSEITSILKDLDEYDYNATRVLNELIISLEPKNSSLYRTVSVLNMIVCTFIIFIAVIILCNYVTSLSLFQRFVCFGVALITVKSMYTSIVNFNYLNACAKHYRIDTQKRM